MDRIFVQIASYRDADLANTINSALTNAEYPQRLRFGICWQYDERTCTDLDPYLRDERFRVAQFFYEDSEGCCWARNQINRLYEEEEYTLQIDAHMRFAPRWDTRYVNMLCSIDSEKPLLTTYPAPFEVVNGVEELVSDRGMQRLTLNRMRKDLTTVLKTEVVDDQSRCMPCNFVAAGQIFTLGRFCTEVEYDPGLYFVGEEINLAVRAYTHGYDFFCPKEDLVWHKYKHIMRTHWADHESTLHDNALSRLKTLMVGDHTRLGRYGLGNKRSLCDYQRLVEINFAERLKRTPTPVQFDQTVELNVSAIKDRGDYHFWIFTLRNIDDDELFRRDIYDEEILRKRVKSVHVSEFLEDEPVSYMIWPNIRDVGYIDQYCYDL